MTTQSASKSNGLKNPVAVIILGAGHGTRMKSSTPKVLHQIAGRSMLGHVMDYCDQIGTAQTSVVIGDHSPQVGKAATSINPDTSIFVQSPPQGTGDAVKQALPALENFKGTVLIVYADTPLIVSQTLIDLCKKIEAGMRVSVLGFTPSLEHAYGRLITNKNDELIKIVEHKDANATERAVNFCNSGVMAVDSAFLKSAVPAINNDNAKGEYYLTDLVGMAIDQGHKCAAIEAPETEVMGVDARTDLAYAENLWQHRTRTAMMQEGVTLADPSTVYFNYDTKIGRDVVIGQNVVFGPGVVISDGVEIKPFSHLEGTHIDTGSAVGPFARLRPGAMLGEDVKVGNFVEIKKTNLGKGAKVSHLTYLGDADIGKDTNIGAGTITCNYDGFNKSRTTIKDGAFIGSNSSLVAPVTINKGAYVGSGSVITKDVEEDALAVARGKQVSIPGWAKRFNDKNKKG